MLTATMTDERERRRGPKPVFGAPMTRRVSFWLTDEQFHDLKSVAASEGKEPAELVRDAVDCYVGDFREKKMFFLTKKSYRPE